MLIVGDGLSLRIIAVSVTVILGAAVGLFMLVMLCGVIAAIHFDRGVLTMLAALVVGGLTQFVLSWYMVARLQPFRLSVNTQMWGQLLRFVE